MEKQPILVVDDEEKILSVVKLYLEKDGYEVTCTDNGVKALNLFRQNSYALLILDLMLPGLSGEAVCKEVRKTSRVPVIMLTAKSAEENIVAGFDIGADDYILKPFSPRQLVARVQAVLRRSAGDIKPLANILSFNDDELIIDNNQYEVFVNHCKADLTPIEFKVLSLLAAYPNRAFSRDDIIQSIYHDDFEGYDRAIDSHIKNLRKKIMDNPPKYILTVHGVGYKFGGEPNG